MEKVPAKVISTEGGIVCTHGMYFYHRSPCKPPYIAFRGIFSSNKTTECHAQENDRDFKVPFKNACDGRRAGTSSLSGVTLLFPVG